MGVGDARADKLVDNVACVHVDDDERLDRTALERSEVAPHDVRHCVELRFSPRELRVPRGVTRTGGEGTGDGEKEGRGDAGGV